jgi:hypothetical protein
MKKQKSMMDHMRSRNAMVGGDEPTGKKLQVQPTSGVPKPEMKTPNLQKTLEDPKHLKRRADTDRKNRTKGAWRNVGKWALITAGEVAGGLGAYYGLTKEVGGKDIKDYSGRVTGKTEKKRIWRWKDE